MKYSRQVYKASGQIILQCECSSIIRGRRVYTTIEEGTNTSSNIAQDIHNARFILNAKLNAVYKHIHSGGNSQATARVLSYTIRYHDHDVRRVTRNYRTRSGKRRRYNVVLDRKSGKRLGWNRWRQPEEFE